ncbi:four-helix bundle copper-binding protein [Paraclostridium dentum]|uniref:four-helix bundle copper-binding protein n=1 Tax=Paraclostridium dentum TaxID=2662455 RepID=UPI00051DA166|nr:four-helix bundle copper-binding protein [Paraclostridium dentum]KGJ50731.1 ferredoxin [Clostridium sp. NCR]
MGIVTNKTDKHQACIDECQKCAQACYECFNECLNEPDIKERKNCVSTLVECAMMCQMSVSMMAMNGKFSKEHCELCAKICEQCEQECAMFKDDHCQKCASVCRSCADECRKMANM